MTKKINIFAFMRGHQIYNLRVDGHRIVVFKNTRIHLLYPKYPASEIYTTDLVRATVTQPFVLPPRSKISLLVDGSARVRIPMSLVDDRPKYVFTIHPTELFLVD